MVFPVERRIPSKEIVFPFSVYVPLEEASFMGCTTVDV
jgi:hypothetical protein